MSRIEVLEWDTEFFGYKVGRIDYNEGAAISILPSEFRLIYVFSEQPINEISNKLVDKKACYVTLLNNKPETIENNKYQILPFDANAHNYSTLLQLTLESGTYSRFFLDKNFRDREFERLYTKWIENSLKDEAPLGVFIAIENNQIIGFITLGRKSREVSEIGLLAVGASARGKKVATNLINFVKQKAIDMGFQKMQVITQLDNTPATKLYESNNFILHNLTYIYHIWNYDTV
ncbi:GNAT family N-acetyltransferase [Niabella beijingensis]|uniref:GNAT family N-acetyltransferase n=1 Tax=Niabella beijingensis TaxID=2872700 RepID=UPI001CBD2D21|nr:GNAT family N-acetyltransferase [Niabella beijingensis]MBZ4191523.1 GNAT family N-acetyltransferase [Niabella beijingensis]